MPVPSSESFLFTQVLIQWPYVRFWNMTSPFSSYSIGDQTEGLVHARQALDHLATYTLSLGIMWMYVSVCVRLLLVIRNVCCTWRDTTFKVMLVDTQHTATVMGLTFSFTSYWSNELRLPWKNLSNSYYLGDYMRITLGTSGWYG